MSKVKEKIEDAEVIEDHSTNGTAEPTDKPKEAIDTLRVQLKEHLERADFHKTMATKAQGALEVLLQLHPQKEESEG